MRGAVSALLPVSVTRVALGLALAACLMCAREVAALRLMPNGFVQGDGAGIALPSQELAKLVGAVEAGGDATGSHIILVARVLQAHMQEKAALTNPEYLPPLRGVPEPDQPYGPPDILCHFKGMCKGPRLYDGEGVLLESAEALLALGEGDSCYIVPDGLHWYWPDVAPGEKRHIKNVHKHTGDDPNATVDVSVTSLCTDPRLFVLENFFTPAEADQLIADTMSAEGEDNKMKRSSTGHVPDRSGVTNTRTSDNAFITDTPIAIAIKKRAFDLLRVTPYHWKPADGIQVLRYTQKQAYMSHTDYFSPDTSADHQWDPTVGGSTRFATIFLYLTDVIEGGETVFPESTCPRHTPDGNASNVPEDWQAEDWEVSMTLNQCQKKMAVKPTKGGAIMFYNQLATGEMNPNSLHGGCPVLAGEKWAANVWVWNGPRFLPAEADRIKSMYDGKKVSLDEVKNGDIGHWHGDNLDESTAIDAKFTNLDYKGDALELCWLPGSGAAARVVDSMPIGRVAHQNTYHSHKFGIRFPGTKEMLQTWIMDARDGLTQTFQAVSTYSSVEGESEEAPGPDVHVVDAPVPRMDL